VAIRVGVIGASGRMGAEVCRAVEGDSDLELVGRVGHADPLDVLVDGGAEVAVDFTTPKAVKDNVSYLLEHEIHAVVGTSGLSEQDIAELESTAADHAANVLIAPNFAVGAVLMMRFAAQAAPFFDAAEIVERHRAGKLDKPSGTSLRTAALMDSGRRESWTKPIEIHSLRLPGSVAHQEVVLGGPGETLTIRHDSLDRASFMPGVLLAIKNVGSRRGVTVGLEHLLDL
jgi:4-hydroxy-tetrahydrodipicolinate reductase